MNIRKHRSRKTLPAFTLLMFLFTGCASQGPPEYGAVTGPEKGVSGPVGEVNEIVLEIPAGSVNVIAAPDSHVSAKLEIRCDEKNKSCVRLAESVELQQQVFEHRMFVRPSTKSRFAFRNSDSKYQFTVPENIPVRIIMGYGSLSVKGLRNDLTIDMSAGDISVEAPRSAVRRVWADANFGDASLIGADSGRKGERRLLVGAEADWHGGTGEHDIVVDLNAGDISVILTPIK